MLEKDFQLQEAKLKHGREELELNKSREIWQCQQSHPVQVSPWPFDFSPGIKTKFKKLNEKK